MPWTLVLGLAKAVEGGIVATEIKSHKETMIMFVARCIFPVLLLLCASNSFV